MPPAAPRAAAVLPHPSPWPRLGRRIALWLAGLLCLGWSLIYLTLHFLVLPRIADYRGEVERQASAALGQPVTIAHLAADWEWLRPRFHVDGVRILNPAGRPVLELDQVDAVVGWTSLLLLEPRFHRLELEAPRLDVRRDAAGRLFVAGLAVSTQREERGVGDWLLSQNHIVVRHAWVSWNDEQRRAPLLTLDNLNLNLQNDLGHHRFGFTAEPPRAMAARLDIRGDLRGRRLSQLEDWEGQLYAELDYTDLAAWRAWVDYPLELPRGRGGLRLWLDREQSQPVGLTADVSLADVEARLAPNLPMLELERLSGRFTARRLADGFELSTRALALRTRNGIELPATDLRLDWQAREGAFTANELNLGLLGRLADYLPLPPKLRTSLTAYAPRGHFSGIKLDWHGRQQAFEQFNIKGRFTNVALAAQEVIPGMEGISGRIEGNEKSGIFELGSQGGALDFPSVFAESRIPLESLEARGGWRAEGVNTEIQLSQIKLRNRDAEGQVSGRYLHKPGQLGEIDLDARFSRAEATAVWRYMPRVVSTDVALWLKEALRGGRASEATLKLKGDLNHFPFAKGGGIFRIQGKFHGGSLKYAPDWPQIDDITGNLLFEGVRMNIEASQGRSLGAALGSVKAEIADLSAPEERLVIKGQARGATSQFLQFIESSPVAGWIEHATADMAATGTGELDLNLTLPLRQLSTSQVQGGYRFDANRLLPDPAMPALEDVRGRLEFTHHGIAARALRARILGGPATIDIATGNDGQVAVDARGDVNGVQLRQQFPGQPLLDHLSGGARWTGTVRIKGRGAELRLVSDLKGLTSSLPEPFNKPATEARSLVFERKPIPASTVSPSDHPAPGRDQIELSLGKTLQMQLQRRTEGGISTVERGLIRIGDIPARLPDHGTLLAVGLPRFDLDFWRPASSANAQGKNDSNGLNLTSADLRVDELVAFGRIVHGLRLTGQRHAGQWSADLKSSEMQGRLEWREGGAGRLSGRLAHFSLPAAMSGKVATDDAAKLADSLRELPDLDLSFDHFVHHERDLGEVRINAENKGGDWHTRLSLHSEDGDLSGQGRWRTSAEAPSTRFDFKLKARSVEKLLNRIGYPDAVRRGSANLEGNLSWSGPPFAIDYPSLSGGLRVKAQDGQFNKLEPGAGRLLGILSLQSLPRRITLDFRDVFSDGFAFDAIEGQAGVSQGVMETQDLEIRGPSARVAMQGRVNLVQETQNLLVRVQPALGETITTGVLLANPATGAAYWLANKLFGGPLDKVFAFEYAITGSWADPKVEKVGEPKLKEGQ